MILLLLAWLSPAHASDHIVVRTGDTLASIAEDRGDPELVNALRRANGLGPDQEPVVGTVLLIPGGDQAPLAVLHSFMGTGSILIPGGSTTPLELAVELPEGSRVCTDEDSYATIRLAADIETGAHDDLNLWTGTCVVIESLSSALDDRSSLVQVESGSISLQSTRAGESEGRITLRTSDAVATADGGGQRLHVEDGSTRAEAVDKGMSVIAEGVELELEAGQGSRVKNGEAPGAPVTLLLPGAHLRPTPRVSLRVPSFSWKPVPEAAGYQIELGMDRELREVVLLQALVEPGWDPSLLVVPYRDSGFWWRICAYDEMGFLGIPTTAEQLLFPEGVAP